MYCRFLKTLETTNFRFLCSLTSLEKVSQFADNLFLKHVSIHINSDRNLNGGSNRK